MFDVWFSDKKIIMAQGVRLFIYAQSGCKSFVSCILNVWLFIFCLVKCQSLYFFFFWAKTFVFVPSHVANLALNCVFVNGCVNIWIEHMGKVLSFSCARTLLFVCLIGRVACRHEISKTNEQEKNEQDFNNISVYKEL